MRQVVRSALQTAFEACCQGTIAEGANLVIEVDPVTMTCGACGVVRKAGEIPHRCSACRSYEISVEGGRAMEITSITMDQETGDGHSDHSKRAGAQRRHGG